MVSPVRQPQLNVEEASRQAVHELFSHTPSHQANYPPDFQGASRVDFIEPAPGEDQ